jgi:putative intracellular protease/amidase
MEAKTVHLFVFDGMADWEAAFAIAGINNPEFQLHPGSFRVATVSAAGGTITTIGGVRIEPDGLLDEVAPETSAMLILPGGQSWERGGNQEAIEKAKEFLQAGMPVAAICAATLALARAGLLEGREHTSNAPEYIAYSGYGGAAHYLNEPAVTDGALITASGVAPVDFAYHIFRVLGLYSEAALEAWYALFRNGDASKYYALVAAG